MAKRKSRHWRVEVRAPEIVAESRERQGRVSPECAHGRKHARDHAGCARATSPLYEHARASSRAYGGFRSVFGIKSTCLGVRTTTE